LKLHEDDTNVLKHEGVIII